MEASREEQQQGHVEGEGEGEPAAIACEALALELVLELETPITTTKTTASTEKELDSPPPRRRHGSRNQHRHQKFCKWLVETFDFLKKNDIIVDVGGGKGELASRLAICHQFQVILIDPRPANVLETFQTLVLPKLPKKHQERIQTKSCEDPHFLEDVLQQRVQQLELFMTHKTLATNSQLRQSIQKAKLIIGLHSDGATECIVDAAILYRKPFVVVPCCVFPNFFPDRYVFTTRDNGERIPHPVRTHPQFCDYLLQKCNDSLLVFQQKQLPLEGRNVAIYWDGKDHVNGNNNNNNNNKV